MKLIRFGAPGAEKPGILDANLDIRDLSGQVEDWSGEALDPQYLAKLASMDIASLPLVTGEVRLGVPVGQTQKLIGIGLNYADHAEETGMPIPVEPIVFLKAPSCISGPFDDIEQPRGSTQLDWEVELAVVIGKRAKYITEQEAMQHVAGLTICNDVSERSFQFDRNGQWTKGKSHDSFAPLGPWLVTLDEINDLDDLSLWLDVNGERRQTGNTSKMIFSIPKLISYLSEVMTLLPGDIIATGTPPGVGVGMQPPTFLQVGDVVSLGIEGLGEQRQMVRAI